MVKKTGKERRLFSCLCLLFLFAVYILGTLLGNGCASKVNISTLVSFDSGSVFFDLLRHIVYCGIVLMASRTLWGVFIIPTVICIRAFVFSAAVSALIGSSAWLRNELICLCVPFVFYLSGLFYMAVLGCSVSAFRLKQSSLQNENINEYKRGCVASVVFSVIGVFVDLILNTL